MEEPGVAGWLKRPHAGAPARGWMAVEPGPAPSASPSPARPERRRSRDPMRERELGESAEGSEARALGAQPRSLTSTLHSL